MSNKFIPWTGGPMPVEYGTRVEVTHRSGRTYVDLAGYPHSDDDGQGGYAEDWNIDPDDLHDGDIVAYRVIQDDTYTISLHEAHLLAMFLAAYDCPDGFSRDEVIATRELQIQLADAARTRSNS